MTSILNLYTRRPGANFYTELVDTTSEFEGYNTGQLISMSQRLAETLEANMPSLRQLAATKDGKLNITLRSMVISILGE